MKIRSIILLAFACIAACCNAQGLTAAKCLGEAPAEVIPLLDKNTRLDMIDYFLAGQSKPSTNSLAGSSSIVEMNDTSVIFNLTDSIRAQMFVLNPSSPSPVIGLITTFPIPLADSSVEFYNSRWQKLPGLLPEARLTDWLTAEGKGKRAKVEEELPFILASYSFDPATLTLTATNNTSTYYTPDDTPEALSLLKPQIVYSWDGKRFKPASR